MVYNCMSYAGCLTDWAPNCDREVLNKIKNNIPNNNEYRYYLQDNATKIMEASRKNYFCNTGDPSQTESGDCKWCCQCTKKNPFESFAPRWSESFYPEKPLRGG
jgi:hypothetical protein